LNLAGPVALPRPVFPPNLLRRSDALDMLRSF
jgi:hypothetical protein